MILTMISIISVFALFIGLAVLALRHGVDTRTDASNTSLVSGDFAARGFWR